MPEPVEGFEVNEMATLRIASRRELFTDGTVVGALTGTARLHLHRPMSREVVLIHDAPWEGNTCGYATMFCDESAGGICRMYYRGSGTVAPITEDEPSPASAHRAVTCYAQSADGIHWTKPDLDLVAFEGSTENNIVWDGIGSHNFAPFLDTRPDCPYQSRYKA
ncbi:MAG: hypothetical protein JXC32_14185, partial [Anaerolineae bacterium]|nr:hypothetical protein [Anaerolineae bacterium]